MNESFESTNSQHLPSCKLQRGAGPTITTKESRKSVRRITKKKKKKSTSIKSEVKRVENLKRSARENRT